jgi:hypothetical protein
MSIQATMNAFKDKIENRVADEVEQKFDEIASYAVYVAVPDQSIDTGAYVTSFSIGRAGFGGGRSRSSDNKPKNQNPQAMKDQAYSQLIGDIDRIDFKAMLESGDARFTLKNRAPHARNVEDGTNWRRSGYHVFAKIRNQFG